MSLNPTHFTTSGLVCEYSTYSKDLTLPDFVRSLRARLEQGLVGRFFGGWRVPLTRKPRLSDSTRTAFSSPQQSRAISQQSAVENDKSMVNSKQSNETIGDAETSGKTGSVARLDTLSWPVRLTALSRITIILGQYRIFHNFSKSLIHSTEDRGPVKKVGKK